MGLGERLFNFVDNLDRAVASLFGARWFESVSGTVGRAADADKPWAVRVARPLVNAVMFNPHHCQEAVAYEADLARKLGVTP